MNPKTVVCMFGGTELDHSRPRNARDTYSWREMCDKRCSERKPLITPQKPTNVVNNGSAMKHATTLGTTSNFNESTDNASIASICLVARISARDAPIPAPTSTGNQ